MQQPGNMTAVKMHMTVLLDQAADAPGRPQLGAETIGYRTLQEQLDNLLTRSPRQCRWSTGREPHLQRVHPAALSGIAPTHHRTRRRPQHTADLIEREALIQQPQGLVTA